MSKNVQCDSDRDGSAASDSGHAESDHSRQRVVAEVRSWKGTPYVTGARSRGAGCDCATLVYMALTACGVIAPEEIGLFQGDWWMHTSEQIYLQRMLKHAGKVAEGICYRSTETLPGNILLTKAAGSRVWNHGGIVTEWPLIVHAVKPRVCEVDATADPLWAMRQIAVLDPWEKKQKGGESK